MVEKGHLESFFLIRTVSSLLKKALLAFSPKLFLGKSLGDKVLAGRLRWLLETMMRKQGIDIQELDVSLDYWEAKAEIEAKYRTKLVLKLDKIEEKMLKEPSGKYCPTRS